MSDIPNFDLEQRIELLELQLRDAELLLAVIIKASGGTIRIDANDIVTLPATTAIVRTNEASSIVLQTVDAKPGAP